MAAYGDTKKIPFAIMFIARFTYPLQGFFNILVYTYPHVTSCKRNDSNLSWLGAFWVVVKSGGDSDEQRSGRTNRRRSSMRKKKLLESKYNLQLLNALDDDSHHQHTTKNSTEAIKNSCDEETKEEIIKV